MLLELAGSAWVVSVVPDCACRCCAASVAACACVLIDDVGEPFVIFAFGLAVAVVVADGLAARNQSSSQTSMLLLSSTCSQISMKA